MAISSPSLTDLERAPQRDIPLDAPLVIVDDEPLDPAETKPPVRVYSAEEVLEGVIVERGNWPRRTWRGMCAALEWLFGLASLLFGLAVLATVPILQFLALGYLLECSGRISRTGRMRDGFIGIRGAGRIGGFILGAWLWLLPLRLAADMWYDAWLIDPHSSVTQGWRVGFALLAVAVFAHISWAWLRGGRLRHFLWPAPWRFLKSLPKTGELLSQKADELWEFAAGMRIPYFFWLGVRGFAVALTWLFIPTLLLIAAPRLPNPGVGVLAGLLGGAMMAMVLLYIPFMQAHFAAENRFVAFFEWRRVRDQFRRAPIAFWSRCSLPCSLPCPFTCSKSKSSRAKRCGCPAWCL